MNYVTIRRGTSCVRPPSRHSLPGGKNMRQRVGECLCLGTRVFLCLVSESACPRFIDSRITGEITMALRPRLRKSFATTVFALKMLVLGVLLLAFTKVGFAQ